MFNKLSLEARSRIILILKAFLSIFIILLYSFVVSTVICAFFGLDQSKIIVCLFVGIYFYPLSAIQFLSFPFSKKKDNN